MSVLTPVKEEKSKVHTNQYLRSEDTPVEEEKPAEDTATTDETATQDATPATG